MRSTMVSSTDYLDNYFFDYAVPAPARISFPVHRTVRVGALRGPWWPAAPHIPRFRFTSTHCGTVCPYGPRSAPCIAPVQDHQVLVTIGDISHWTTSYPGVVLNLRGRGNLLEEVLSPRMLPQGA